MEYTVDTPFAIHVLDNLYAKDSTKPKLHINVYKSTAV